MNKEKYLQDISEIKTLMHKSSRFISLSGLSGILAGIYALIGAWYAYWLVNFQGNGYLPLHGGLFKKCILILCGVGVVSIATAILLTTRKAKRNQEKIWDTKTKTLLIRFLVPLVAGGVYILIMLIQGRYGQSGSLMLLFYGIALYSASNYTLGYVKYLGITEILLGLVSALFPGYGFWFWVVGFGWMHIFYGSLMYWKYDKNRA